MDSGAAIQIICPYCFERFWDTEVDFRLETVLRPEELNSEGLYLDEINAMPDSLRKRKLLSDTKKRQVFLRTEEDLIYENFWEPFGGTSEYYGNEEIPGWRRPVASTRMFNAETMLTPVHLDCTGRERFLVKRNGFTEAVVDANKVTTRRRVCPACHNPLPAEYGMYPVRLVAVIGKSGVGKTAFMEKLMDQLCADRENDIVRWVPINLWRRPDQAGTASSDADRVQPMVLRYWRANGEIGDLVFREVLTDSRALSADLTRYGQTVSRAQGLVILLSPDQGPYHEQLYENMNLIHLYGGVEGDNRLQAPTAVCITKSDLIEKLPATAAGDIKDPCAEIYGIRDLHFPSEEFNANLPYLKDALGMGLMMAETNLAHYNFFYVSSGNPETGEEGRRLREPLLWLMKQWNVIKSDGPVLRPMPRHFHGTHQVTTRRLFRVDVQIVDNTEEEDLEAWNHMTEEERAQYFYEA